MVEVMLLHVAEIGIAKVAEVGRVVNPLFSDIGLEREGHHDRSGVGWEQQNAQGHPDEEEWQQILYSAAHVFTVKRLFVMPEMRGVEVLVCYARPKPFVASLRYFPMAVQDVAVRKVFGQHPKHNTGRNEGDSAQQVTREKCEHHQDHSVRGIEGGSAIDLVTRDNFLLAFVNAIRMLSAHLP